MSCCNCPDCGGEMEHVVFEGYGFGMECPKCHRQILMEDEDEE